MKDKVEKRQDQVTIAVVDTDGSVQESLRTLFESVHYSVECFNSAQEFLHAFSPHKHYCVISELRLQGISGLELQDELNTQDATIPIIFITAHGNIDIAVRAIKNGAEDFLTKPVNNELLLDTVSRVIKRLQTKIQQQQSIQNIWQRYHNLTPREKEVMGLMAEGKLNKNIAHELEISTSTVELHRAKVMKKMQANTIAKLVKMAIMAGITPIW